MEQGAGEPVSVVNGISSEDGQGAEEAQSNVEEENEDQNNATIDEESSDGDGEDAEEMDQDTASDDDDEEDDDDNTHLTSLSSRPTDLLASDVILGRQSEDKDDPSDSAED